jgi:hypothetical protein
MGILHSYTDLQLCAAAAGCRGVPAACGFGADSVVQPREARCALSAVLHGTQQPWCADGWGFLADVLRAWACVCGPVMQ